MPSPWPLGSFLPHPAWRAAVSTTRRRRPVSTGYRSGDSPWFQVSPSVSGLTWRAGPITSSRKSFGSRRSEEHTSELQSLAYLVCRLLLEKKKSKEFLSFLCFFVHNIFSPVSPSIR